MVRHKMNNPWQQPKPADWSKPNPWPVANAIKAPIQPVEAPSPYDAMPQDQVLMEWQKLQQAVTKAKEAEMDMRKYIVKRAFPQATEGMNTADLGNGYQLKASVKYNYNLDPDLDKVEKTLDKIATMGNEGAFLADRLVKWSASFLLTEYRKLCEDDATNIQKAIRKEVDGILTITDAAPSLEIKEPKKVKK